MKSIFDLNMILIFRRKMKDDLSRNVHGKMIFSIYSVKILFLFTTNMILPFCQKSQDGFLLKHTLKDDIFASLKKKS